MNPMSAAMDEISIYLHIKSSFRKSSLKRISTQSSKAKLFDHFSIILFLLSIFYFNSYIETEIKINTAAKRYRRKTNVSNFQALILYHVKVPFSPRCHSKDRGSSI